MWIFAPEGLLMPAAVPMDKADPHFTENGKYDFQIRARVAEHLENFMKAYMEPGTYNPEIQLTPNMDYNARFYTTREAFAAAMAKSILDITYEKFKPTAYDHNEKQHPYYDTLNAIWGTVTRLGRPGGKWGYGSYSGNKKLGSFVGSSFGFRADADLDEEPQIKLWGEPGFFDSSELDYTPTIEDQIDDILEDVRDIPVNQWRDFLEDWEWDLVKSIAAERTRAQKKGRRRATKRRANWVKAGR